MDDLEKRIANLRDKDENARRVAARALGEMGDIRAIEPLCQALRDEAESVRRASVEALGRIGDARAVEPLCQALRDDAENARRSVVASLGRIGESSVEPLRWALGEEDSSLREYAAEALGRIASVNPNPSLRKALPILRHLTQTSYCIESYGIDAFTDAIKRIEKATRSLIDLPTPATIPTPSVEALPISTEKPACAVESLPIPSNEVTFRFDRLASDGGEKTETNPPLKIRRGWLGIRKPKEEKPLDDRGGSA